MPFLETALASGAVFLGSETLKLISDAAKSYVNKRFEGLFVEVEKKLSRKERDALELAYADTIAHGFSASLDALSNVLRLTGMDDDEMRRHRTEVLIFLQDEEVGDILWDSISDLSNPHKPSAAELETQWALTGWNFPIPGIWPIVAANFRDGAKNKAFVTPQLREILVAKTIDRITELQHQILGVQIAVRQDQYIRVMRAKYGQVELANVAPAYAEDPGVLIVTDIFEPQHVRENPPPVEITKDEFEKLIRDRKIDRDGEDAIIALLEDGEGKEAAERLKFQRSTYADQPVRPVLHAIVSLELLTPRGFTAHERLQVITGEPGSGKSTLLRYLLLGILQPPSDPENPQEPLKWTKNFTGEREHFPLLIELRDYHFTCRDEAEVNCFLDYVNYLGESQGWGLNAQWLHDRLSNERSLVMFDGLDEIFDKRERDTVMKQIAGFAESYPRACIIVTSRPHGYHEGILRPVGFRHYRLQDLDREQKERFVRAWFTRVFPKSQKDRNARIERVLGAIERSPSVRWLAGNPLLLTIMCLIGREKDLPRERARFYEECVDVLVHKWDLNHHLHIEGLEFLDIDDKKDLLRRIAFHMQASKAGLRGNFIGEGELIGIIESWFREEHELQKASAKLAAKQMIQGLWERNYLLCPRGPKLYGFLHRTFMEYLTAMEYVGRFQQVPDFDIEDLSNVFQAHGNEPEWSEVLRLICGSIGDQYAEHFIQTLLSIKPSAKGDITAKNQPNHLTLAIRCLGELRGLSRMESLALSAVKETVTFLQGANSVLYGGPPIRDELLEAANEIGTRWPKSGTIRKFLVEPKEFSIAKKNRRSFEDTFVAFETAILQDYQILIVHLENKDWRVRRLVLNLVMNRNEWMTDVTRQLLEQYSVSDNEGLVRVRAIELLSNREEWADEATLGLLRQRAVDDTFFYFRVKALELICKHKKWQDPITRDLLYKVATDDENYMPRSIAMQLLSTCEEWAETWKDGLNHLETQIREAKDEESRGAAACMWFEGRANPRLNDNEVNPVEWAKHLVFSADVDGIPPFIDSLEAVSDEHLNLVAANAQPEALDADQLQQMIEEMNLELGWDIRKGFRLSASL